MSFCSLLCCEKPQTKDRAQLDYDIPLQLRYITAVDMEPISDSKHLEFIYVKVKRINRRKEIKIVDVEQITTQMLNIVLV